MKRKTTLRRTNKQTGFTLFELLVATAIFGIVSYMAYSGLMQVMNTRNQTGERELRLSAIQMTFLNLERDIQQIVKRPIHDTTGLVEGELVGDELADYRLLITRGGRYIPEGIPRSSLQRVGYLLEDNALYRVTWRVLDQAQDSEPRRAKLLDNVENVEIRFLDAQGEWQTSWDSLGTPANQQPNAAPVGLPRAVAIKFTLKGYGAVNRMFLLPEAG